MNQFHQPSGRACVRKTSDGFITLGVMHFDDQFQPVEFAGYPMALASDGITVTTEKLDTGPGPYYVIDQLTGWCTQNSWRSGSSVTQPDLSMDTVRFVKALGNSYTFLSVSREDPFAKYVKDHAKDSSHYMVDFDNGRVLPFESPITGHKGNGFNGKAISQILRDYAIWPDQQGSLRTLPDLSTAAREKFQKLRDIDRQIITGQLSPEQSGRLRLDLGEMGTSPIQEDDNHKSYLRIALEYGMDSVEKSMTVSELQSKEAFSKTIIKAIYEGSDLESPELHAQLETISGKVRLPLMPEAPPKAPEPQDNSPNP